MMIKRTKRFWVTDDHPSLVEYEMTLGEIWQTLVAFRKARKNGGCAADYMSDELELLHCSFVPSRYRVIKHNI